MFHCDSRKFNLTSGFFISLFIVTGRAIIFICSTALLYLMIIRCCLLHMVPLYIFSKNFNFDDSGISFPAFPSTTNLKLQNIPITPKKVEKFITDLDFCKKTGPSCIKVVVLKNCEPELSYILVHLLNNCLNHYCFPDWWKILSVVHVFKNIVEWSEGN